LEGAFKQLTKRINWFDEDFSYNLTKRVISKKAIHRKIVLQNLPGFSRSAVPQLCPSREPPSSSKGKPSKSGYDFKGLLVAGARFELTTFRL
jgi:hypothetical protein